MARGGEGWSVAYSEYVDVMSEVFRRSYFSRSGIFAKKVMKNRTPLAKTL